jgi:CBS domain-containing protein
MCLYRAHGLPVVDGGKLMGVLSSGDVHKASFHTNPSGKRSG